LKRFKTPISDKFAVTGLLKADVETGNHVGAIAIATFYTMHAITNLSFHAS
jgi:hypothetical protein